MTEQRDVRAGMLSLAVAEEAERSVIRLSGELDLANADSLEAELDKALGDDHREVVVDLERLSFIDSTGLALLIRAVDRDGDRGRLSCVPSRGLAVQRVLHVTGLDQRLPFLGAASPD